MKKTIKKAMTIKNEKCSFKYTFVKEKADAINICGYLTLLLLDYGKVKYAILMIDANNIEKKFRIKIENFIKEKGFEPVVISTDNHSKTGMPPKLDYRPVGADESDINVVYSFLDKIDFKKINNEDEIGYSKKNVDAKVMGEHFLKNLEDAVLQIGKKGVYLFFFIVILQLITAILLGIISV